MHLIMTGYRSKSRKTRVIKPKQLGKSWPTPTRNRARNWNTKSNDVVLHLQFKHYPPFGKHTHTQKSTPQFIIEKEGQQTPFRTNNFSPRNELRLNLTYFWREEGSPQSKSWQKLDRFPKTSLPLSFRFVARQLLQVSRWNRFLFEEWR